jgi:hypothetical protein
MAGQSTYFMLINFKGNLPEKAACDSLSDSKKAVYRNFSASEYQLNMLILIMCRLQRSTQDKGLKFNFFLAFFEFFLVL